MASSRQTYRCDPSIIQPKADRQAIESVCGPPDLLTSLDGGKAKAIYKIDPNAVTGGTKAAEIGTDVVFDVFSLGLWEAVATPIEIGSSDKIVNYIVIYTGDNKVETVETLK